jgi:hypothetical protein
MSNSFFHQVQIEVEIDFDQLSKFVNHEKRIVDLNLSFKKQYEKIRRRNDDVKRSLRRF